MNLNDIPIIDHHAHPILKPEALNDINDFTFWFTESSEIQVYSHQIKSSIFFKQAMRWISEDLLSCNNNISDIFSSRIKKNHDIYTNTIFKKSNITNLMCDFGFPRSGTYNLDEMEKITSIPIKNIVRIETIAEEIILSSNTMEDFTESFTECLLSNINNQCIAFKTIIAYRTGISLNNHSKDILSKEFKRVKTENNLNIKLNSKPLNEHILKIALKIAEKYKLPFQFHTGFGDNDVDLIKANPLKLKPIIEKYKTPIIILHAGWPYYREAAFLCSIYSTVWLDISLAVPHITTGIYNLLLEVAGIAPLEKILFATDASGLPELYWIACKSIRIELEKVLKKLVSDKYINNNGAYAAAENILYKNSRKVYCV
ncbi:MAG TPA: amidohydrolase family protein [Victivallales bacterium]|nr:amidohydrolase family protein [Victivallales bacterium]